MAPEIPPLLRRLTLVLAAIAYAAVEVASDADGTPTRFGLAFGAALLAAAVVASYLVPLPRPGQRLPRRATLILSALLLAPLVLEPALRKYLGLGLPLELRLIFGLRAAGLGLAALAAWPVCLRLAGVASLFNMLFVSAMGDQPPVPYLLGAYALAGGLWLVLMHAAQLRPAVESSAAAVVRRASLRFPARHALVSLALAGVALSLFVVGPRRVVATLGEWLPTSGGTGDFDPFSRGGVNDGNEESRGDNPRATGFAESNKFIESPDPALYDAVNDLYGEPFRPNKDFEKMIAMGVGQVVETKEKPPDNQRPGREFDAVRKSPKETRVPSDRAARALFEVQGRTPLHVRVEVYGRYEVGRWLTAPIRPTNQLIEKDDGSWMTVSARRPIDHYATAETHRLKIAALKETLIPTPPLLSRFRVGRVDRADFFAWEFDGVLRMPQRKTIPPGTTIETQCRTTRCEALSGSDFFDASVWAQPQFTGAPTDCDDLAREWAADVPRGWPQVDAVLRRLRREYTLDPTARVPEDCRDPVRHFLFVSRRGPDYLFASAAVLVLRRLGYPARLALGYYAGPDAFDPETDHTPVVREDLHFWPELMLRDGQWLIVEPTPGYDVLAPRLSLWERITAALQALQRWVVHNPISLSAMMLIATVALWQRRRIIDALVVARWRLAARRPWREAVFDCLRVLERRGRWAGRGRAVGQTLAAWADSLPPGARSDRDLNELLRLGEWAAYAAGLVPPLAPNEVRAVCGRVLSTWTIRTLSLR